MININPEDIMTEDPSQELVNVPDQTVDNILVLAEKRLDNIKRIKQMALTMTNPADWIDQGGKPYLMGSGCEKVARVFQVNIKLKNPPWQKITGTDERGQYYMYIFFGIASLGRGLDEIDVIGKCSSRDKFFGTIDGELKPVAEISEENIMMKAYNNLMMNGVSRLLGLRNLTWEEVKEGTGSRDNVHQVKRYSKKADTEKSDQDEKNDYIAKITRILNEYFGRDEQAKSEALVKVSTSGNLPVAKTISDLKGFNKARVIIVHGKLLALMSSQNEEESEGKEQDKKADKQTDSTKTGTLDL